MRHRRFVPLLGLLLLLAGCVAVPVTPVPPTPSEPESSEGPPVLTAQAKQTGDYFGTISILRIYDDFSSDEASAQLDRAWTEITQMLSEVEAELSAARPESDIARFNALDYGASTPVGRHTAAVIALLYELYDATDGLFDPTIFPLVDLWGFAPRHHTLDYTPTAPYDRPRNMETGGFDLPDQRYLDAFLKLVNLQGVLLEGDGTAGYTLTKNIPSVTVDGVTYQGQLDLGGIGKGYAVDLAREVMLAYGYEYGYFSCGGSSMALLKGMSGKAAADSSGLFELGIRKPRAGEGEGNSYISIAAHDRSLSTSGDYDHGYRVGETVYSHIISPRTGWPMNTPAQDGAQRGIATATVLGDGTGLSAAFDEGLSTALCLMSPEKAIEFLNARLRGYDVALVLYDVREKYYEVVTNISPERVTVGDNAYVLAGTMQADGTVIYSGTLFSS